MAVIVLVVVIFCYRNRSVRAPTATIYINKYTKKGVGRYKVRRYRVVQIKMVITLLSSQSVIASAADQATER